MAEQSAFLTAFDEMQRKIEAGAINTAGSNQAAEYNEQKRQRQPETDYMDPHKVARQDAAAYTDDFSSYMDNVATIKANLANGPTPQAPSVQTPQTDALAEVAGDSNILGAQTPESTIEPFVGNTQTADMRGQDIKKSPIDPTAQPGQGGPQFAERGSPQDFFLSRTNDGTTELSPEQITRGQEYAKQQGLNFDPTTGFSQSGEAPQVQAPQGLTTAGGQPLAEFLAGGQQKDAQGRMIDPNVDRSSFEQKSADREARQAESFGQPRGPDSRDRDRRGTMSMEDATKLTEGNRDAARALLKRQELGLGEFKVQAPSESDILAREKWEDEKSKSGEPTTADKNYLLAERKYNDILAKEQEGTPLTPAEELARERFEYDKDRDAKSDAAGPDKSSTERNIDTMMKANPAMSYTEAANIVQNVVSKTTDPLSGRTSVTNIAEGTSTPMQSTEPLASPVLNLKPKAAGEGLYERGANETGVIASFLRGGQKVVGQAGFDMASDESLEVKKELDAFQGSLSRAFQEGDRFSSSQDKILREELDVTLGVWKDPKTFKANMRSLDKVLRKRHSDLTDNYNDLTLDSDFRADSKSKAKVIEQALNDMGVTQDAKPTEGDTPPEGINPRAAAAWANMSPEGRALFQPQTK